MSKQVQDHLDLGEARIVEEPVAPLRNQVQCDRNFEIPTGLYAATVGLYLAFIAVMFAGFRSPGLVIPMAVFTVFVLAGFGVPAIWVRLKGNDSSPLSFGKFKQAGIMTNTGRLSSRDAVIQMLILPVLIALWACVTVIIPALV